MRIGPRDPDPAAHPELSHLLAAAAAPARPAELDGLEAALEAFERAGEDDEIRVVKLRRRPVGGKVLAVAAAVAVIGGSAFAAESGRLPRGAQQHAHEAFAVVGVPPAGGGRVSGPAVGTASPSVRASVVPPSKVSPSTVSPSTVSPSTAPPSKVPPSKVPPPGLCRAWRKRPQKEPPRLLVELAGGIERVAAYCERVLGAEQGAPGQGRRGRPKG